MMQLANLLLPRRTDDRTDPEQEEKNSQAVQDSENRDFSLTYPEAQLIKKFDGLLQGIGKVAETVQDGHAKGQDGQDPHPRLALDESRDQSASCPGRGQACDGMKHVFVG